VRKYLLSAVARPLSSLQVPTATVRCITFAAPPGLDIRRVDVPDPHLDTDH